MADIRVRGIGRRKLKPKTLLGVLILATLVLFAWVRRDDIALVLDALLQGARAALVVGALFELGRVCFHALAYTRSFKVIGADVPLSQTVPAWFKAVFMNTVVPSGGASGLACIIDVARKRGVAVGSATTATLFTQTCFYLAMFLAILLGFWIMGKAGTLTGRDVAVGSIVGCAALAFVALLVLGHLAPGKLQRALRAVERLGVRVCRTIPFIKKEPAPWADNLVRSFSAAATSLVRNPKRSATVYLSMVVAMAFDALSFIACGYAFDVVALDALFGAYVTALVFNSFNVTPGGAGVVEGLAAAVLAGYGYPLSQALSVVLCYRAFMYWIPLLVGGVMMRASRGLRGERAGENGASADQVSDLDGAYACAAAGANPAADFDGRNAEEGKLGLLARFRRFARTEPGASCLICSTLMAAAAVTAIASSFMSADPVLAQVVSNLVLGWEPMDARWMVVAAAIVLLCLPGIFLRDAANWLVSIAALVGLGFTCALAAHGASTVVLCLASLAALVICNQSFAHHPYQLFFLRLCDRLGLRSRRGKAGE